MLLAFISALTVAGIFFLFIGYLVDFRFQTKRPAKLGSSRKVLKGCAPFTFGDGDGAILAIHGLAGSPAQVREWCKKLADEGYTVYAPLLPGHGTAPDDLYGVKWQHWYGHVESEYLKIRRNHSKVHVVGFSVGSALGLRLASEYKVDSLCLISNPVYLFSDWLPTHLMVNICSLFSNSARTWPQRLPETPDGPEYMIYNRIPLDALKAVVKLVDENRGRMADVTSPTAIFHSKRDFACKPKSARYVHDRIGSEEKSISWFDKAPHSIMHGTDEEKARLHEEVTAFLKS